MKAVFATVLLLSVILVLLPLPGHGISDPSSGCTVSTCNASIQRTVSTNLWGVTTITDNVVLNISTNASSFSYGISKNMSASLRYSVATSSGASLQVSDLGVVTIPSGYAGSGQQYQSMRVGFPQAETGTFSFNLTSIYTGLLTYTAGGSNYQFQLNPFFMSDHTYKVQSSGITISTGDWPSPQIQPLNRTVSGGSYTPPSSPPYNDFNTTFWRVSFSTAGTKQNLFQVSAGRTIQISSSGTIETTDSYNITNLGPVQASISFTVPKGVSSISESYILGLEIDQPSTTPSPTANPDGTSTVAFTPSFGSLSYNQSVKVKISYTLSPGTYVAAGPFGTFNLNFALFNNVQFYSPILTTKIITPVGFRLSSLTGQVPQTSGNQVIVQVSPVTPISNLGFAMTYQLDPFWASLSPLTWAGLVELAIAACVVAVWKGPGAVSALSGASSQLITRFVDLYDEKSSLRMESDKMEEDIARGGMNRYDYKQRRRSLDRQMSEIDRSLAPVKEQLASAQGRYQDMIKKIERAEAELQVIKTTSADLKNQYRSGKLSRDLYESLSNDLARRKERTQQSIDTSMINLREEIR